ncbi:hypothetical protein B0T18DRAFT_426979 [Schizothecium vesticola]|uniref:Uncharacterized protein n=1 Tax=Schizothecium vesticola TaxID=314040 RepID=A0AA40KB24_9PEZI|nr:hypothetical protein B0T18DRAFT_426979 [Schizothecium vesticola]
MAPPRKIKCSFNDCKAAAQRISGDCAFCNGYGPPSLSLHKLEPATNRLLPHRSHYCNNHRLLEDHKCQNLEDCKKEAFDQNLLQLNRERTQVIKGV